jgi:hypothetical protein
MVVVTVSLLDCLIYNLLLSRTHRIE